MGNHARLGPSNHRWPHCPGSIREEERYPDSTSDAAIDGTGTHLLVEMCLKNGVRAEQYDGQVIGEGDEENPLGWFIDLDRAARAQQCLDYVARRVKELGEEHKGYKVCVESETESKPGLPFARDDWWGTVDITISVRHPMTGETVFVEVCDYKDGRGYVSEKDNSQLISYLFGKMYSHVNTINGCRVSIVQPKTNPPVRYQDLDPAHVIDEASKLAEAAHATDDENAPLNPGKHCQWCKANPKRGGHCTAKSEQSFETVKNMSNVIPTVGMSLFEQVEGAIADPKELTNNQLTELADARAGIDAIFDKVEAEIQARIEAGQSVVGYAMKPGRISKIWNDSEEAIVKMLKSRRMTKDDIYPPKLISPAQVLSSDKLTKQQKERISDEYIAIKDGKLKLTKVKHEEKSAKNMFHDIAQNATNELESDMPVEKSPIVTETASIEAKPETISFF
jgi:hypothetical protein